jgi:cell wall-associated NlpC family hydrolase
VASLIVAALVAPAGANVIISGKHLVAKLSAELAADEAQSEALGQRYDASVTELNSLNASVTRLEAEASRKQAAYNKTKAKLVASLVRSYVDGEGSNNQLPLFDQNVNDANAQKIYEQEAVGNLNELAHKLAREKTALEQILKAVQAKRIQASAQAHQIRLLIFKNNTLQQETSATLHRVSAQLSTEIINYEVAVGVKDAREHNSTGVENAVAAASAVGGTAAGNRVLAAVAAVTINTGVSGTNAGSPQGLLAVHYAESQIGVPYVWGGETPGQGFDCSGLTQWAWRAAGVYIPRTAAEQFYATHRVPLDELRPGDLLFYYNLDGDNQIDHVVMYVGSGPYGTSTIIAAAHTGTSIGYEPLFTYGLRGAGWP